MRPGPLHSRATPDLFARVKKMVRGGASLAPLLGLAPRPEARPNGISAIVRVSGEASWIKPCLRSIHDAADEILVFDHGAAPGVRQVLEGLRLEAGGRLTIEQCPAADFFSMSNLALERARFRWVIRWDSDFVAHTSGPEDIAHLRRHLLGLDPRCYYTVEVPAAEVAGDLRHQFPDCRVRRDGQAHTAAPQARYVRHAQDLPLSALSFPDRILRPEPRYRIAIEALRTPPYYRRLHWDRVCYLHVDVKRADQLLRRHFWLSWLREANLARYATLDAYVLAQVRAHWGAADLEEAAATYMARYCEGLVPYDPAASGPYPAMLREFLDTSPFQVEYRDGRIVGRREPGRG
jgi:hypothetical protein